MIVFILVVSIFLFILAVCILVSIFSTGTRTKKIQKMMYLKTIEDFKKMIDDKTSVKKFISMKNPNNEFDKSDLGYYINSGMLSYVKLFNHNYSSLYELEKLASTIEMIKIVMDVIEDKVIKYSDEIYYPYCVIDDKTKQMILPLVWESGGVSGNIMFKFSTKGGLDRENKQITDFKELQFEYDNAFERFNMQWVKNQDGKQTKENFELVLNNDPKTDMSKMLFEISDKFKLQVKNPRLK